jgi:glucosamine--fructose-6-phosphate aminotransferase (isomerizing)
MSLTEKVIFEQFPYWEAVEAMALPAMPDGPVAVTGCGTSYYLALTIAAAFNRAGRRALAVPGAEWARRMGDYAAAPEGTAVIGLSRSGTTTETIQAIETSRRMGLFTLAISCAPETAILKAADRALCLPTHAEEGIVMTASASLMLLAGLRLAGVRPAGAQAAQAAMTAIRPLGPALRSMRHFVFLGGGPLYGVAAEGALKVTEMSLSFAQAFHPMEYRHGPVSLVEPGTFVTLLYNRDTADEEAVLARELQAKGARILGLGGPGDWEVPLISADSARASEVMPALQLLGELVARSKGLGTEAPRHLTKVVVL